MLQNEQVGADIAAKTAQRQAKGLCIQVLKEDNRGLLDLLEKYFENTSRLKIYKGTPQQCMLELEKIYQDAYWADQGFSPM